MKIALVHDFLKEYGGAERVLESLHEMWPEAPIYTSVYLPSYLGPHQERFKDWDIRTSWLQYIPFKEKLISVFRLLAPFVFRGFDFSKFDVVLVSATGAYTPNVIQTGKATHICYCHTPPRYLYGYPTAREWKKNPFFKVFGEIANHVLRVADFNSAQNVDYFIANSENVAGRIKKFYRRDSVVIYPPVDVQNQESRVKNYGKRNYFLTGGRLARPKRIDLAVAACTKLKLPLIVFGKEFAGYGETLKRMAGPTVKFVGEVSEEEKMELMRRGRAFISPAAEEDFGIIPVEVMSVGTPVIAFRSGGMIESIIDGETGLFFQEPTVDSLVSAFKKFESVKFNSQTIMDHTQKFSKEEFQKKIRGFVQKVAHS